MCSNLALTNDEPALLAVMLVPMVDFVEGRADEDFLVVQKRDQDDDRDRNAEKPKQNSTAQVTLLMLRWRD
jgi:hypothetical protein